MSSVVPLTDAVVILDGPCPWCRDDAAAEPPTSPQETPMIGHEFLAEDAPPGELVGILDATWCADQNGVTGDLETELRWTVRGTQDPHQPERVFTLTPLTDDRARAWIRANGRGTTSS